MLLSIIVAVSQNGVIGRDGDMPWKLSTDLKRFKALTLGKPVVMGRKCFQSIGRPLPGRPNIVITRDRAFTVAGVEVVSSLEEGLALGCKRARDLGADEVCVIGGGEIYRQAMDLVDVLHVTHIDATIDGDTTFPAIDANVWMAGEAEYIAAGERDSHPTRFMTYSRKTATK
jgi:dihydrofolate reductase